MACLEPIKTTVDGTSRKVVLLPSHAVHLHPLNSLFPHTFRFVFVVFVGKIFEMHFCIVLCFLLITRTSTEANANGDISARERVALY